MRRHLQLILTGLLTSLLLVGGGALVAASPAAADKQPFRGRFITITKITPTEIKARITCPEDPNPDGSQNFFIGATVVGSGEQAGYFLDVAALCDLQRHHVTVPHTSGVTLTAGERVDVFGSISGDSGEVNVFDENRRVQR